MNDKMGQRLQEIIDNWGAYTEWQTAYKRRKNKSGDKAWIWHGKLYRANMGRHYWCVKTLEDYACVMGVAQRYTIGPDRDGEYMHYVKFVAPLYHQTVEQQFKKAGLTVLYVNGCTPDCLKK